AGALDGAGHVLGGGHARAATRREVGCNRSVTRTAAAGPSGRPQQAARQLAGVLAVDEGGHAALDRPPVAGGVLHEPAPAGGQVVDDAGRPAAQLVEVDDVDV